MNIFPEARVVDDTARFSGRFRWGVGRMVMESRVSSFFTSTVLCSVVETESQEPQHFSLTEREPEPQSIPVPDLVTILDQDPT